MLCVGIVGIVFIVAGLLMLAGGIIMTYTTQTFIKNAISVVGTVSGEVRIDSRSGSTQNSKTYHITYKTIYSYTTPDGMKREYTTRSSSNSRPKIGEVVEIFVNPKNFNDVMENTFIAIWLGPTILGILGIVFSGAGIIVTLSRIAQSKDLLVSGELVECDVKRVELNTRIKINNQNPYRIFATGICPVTGAEKMFVSENILQNPQGRLESTIFVFCDTSNPKKYWMDIRFLNES